MIRSITELKGLEIRVIPSHIDTYNVKVLDYGVLGWLLEVTKISLFEKTKKVGDIIFVQNIGNFTIIV